MDNNILSKNFTRQEIQCRCGCGANDISMDLIARLQEVRESLGQSMRISSGVRCRPHNHMVGGSEKSSHLVGNATAVDIACDNSRYRQKLLKAMMPVFDRIGISGKNGFIHCDVDPNKTAEVVWLY